MDEHGVAIRSFLLGFVASSEAPRRSSAREVPRQRGPGDDLRVQVARHEDPSGTVCAGHDPDATPRCVVCGDDTIQQCTELRLLALRYASHPAYRSEWHPRATAHTGSSQAGAARADRGW
jgi:hypothetical protein